MNNQTLKHTAGPWKYEKGDEDHYPGRHFVSWEGTECDETTICETYYGEHDARLIASAPDMLNILIELASENNMKYLLQPIIEKATGLDIDSVLARQDVEPQ